MSIQSLGAYSYSSAQSSQPFLSGGSDSSGLSGLPQLSSDQLKQLRAAIQQDLRQAFSGGSSSSSGASSSGASSQSAANGASSSSDLQSQLDQSISDTLDQFGFNDSQKQAVIDKINQALSGGGTSGPGASNGAGGANGPGGLQGPHGHGRHALMQALRSVFQSLQSASSGASDSCSDASAATASAPSSGSSGQTLDVTA